MNSTKLSAFCDKALEICWLLAIVITPLFFNTQSNNVFERDKWTTLRTVAVVMAVLWITRLIEERISRGKLAIRVTWRTPLVLPTLLTVVAQIISTIFSLTPYVSVFGGYQRMRGTFSILSGIVIFLIIVDRMRTRVQVDRFITVLILNSLPIALYGFIQHNKLDPLPWGGDVTRRIASNMGNAIFVAAYMIMVALPTLTRIVDAFRAILTHVETGAADVLRAAAYIFMFLVQVISIWYSRSRGPLLGLLAGLALWIFLGLLILQRSARKERSTSPAHVLRDVGRGIGFGLLSLAAAALIGGGLYFAGGALLSSESDTPQWIAAGSAVLTVSGAWMGLIINQKGWRWLWVSALTVGILFVTFFFLINLVFHDWSSQQPWLGRLDDILYEQGGGTGKVRDYIWRGAFEMVKPHDPIMFPPTGDNPTQWRPDKFNFLRPLIGHGPESMYVAYNRFYPPKLGHVESRTATPDRSHNETMDSLVITGLLGFAAYAWLFGGAFYFGLRWLGFLPDDWRRTLFFILIGIGAVVTTVVVSLIPTLGPHFFCLAIPVGAVAGMFIYLIAYGVSTYWLEKEPADLHPSSLLLMGVLCAVLAHFIELQFAFSCAANRTTFWALLGVLVVTGAGLIQTPAVGSQVAGANARQKKRKRRSRRRRRRTKSQAVPPWLGPVLAAGIIGGFFLGTMAFDFITMPAPQDPYFQQYPEKIDSALLLIWRTLTAIPNRTAENCTARWNLARGGCKSYGMLMVFGFTWVMSGVVFITQMAKRGAFRGRDDDWLRATGWYALTSLGVGFAFALMIASHYVAQWTPGFQLTLGYLTATMVYYYLFIILAALGGGIGLLLTTGRHPSPITQWGVVGLLVLTILAGYTAVATNLRPIQADMVYKTALSVERQQADQALLLYEEAIKMTPREDFFYFEKGRSLLTSATSGAAGGGVQISDQDAIAEAIQAFSNAQDIAPLNTDHAKGLAKVYGVWAAAGEVVQRQQRLQQAIYYYDMSTTLSPNNAFLWNQKAQFYLLTLGDLERAQEVISQSLAVDDEYEETWLLQAELYRQQGLVAEAAEAYKRAVEIDPRKTMAWLSMGDLYRQQGQFTQAISAYQRVVEEKPNRADAWLGLAEAYRGAGRLPEAAAAYEQGLRLEPNNAKAMYYLGRSVYLSLGRFEEAAAALQQTLRLAPESAYAWDAHQGLAIVYDQLGQTSEAISQTQKALEKAPQEAQADLQAMLEDLRAKPTEE